MQEGFLHSLPRGSLIPSPPFILASAPSYSLPQPRGSQVSPRVSRSSGLTISHLDIAAAFSLPPVCSPACAPSQAPHSPCSPQAAIFPESQNAPDPVISLVWALLISHKALHNWFPPALPTSLTPFPIPQLSVPLPIILFPNYLNPFPP